MDKFLKFFIYLILEKENYKERHELFEGKKKYL